MKKAYLIDVYNFVFRAFHSMPPLLRKDGVPTGAVYGFINMLLKLLKDMGDSVQESLVAAVLDSGKKTFRHTLYPEYKANRPAVPSELIAQFPIIREAIKAFNLQAVEKEGIEADDLIAAYTDLAVKNGYEVIIISSDKDLLQLITDKVQIYDPLKEKYMHFAEVKEKLGVPPEQVIDYLAIIGDSSDNIPGIKGLGPVAARELLQAYNTLEDIYSHVNNIANVRRRNILIEHKQEALMSKQLVTLHYSDDDIEYTLEDLLWKPHDDSKLLSFLSEQEFKSLITRFNLQPLQSLQNSQKPTKVEQIINVKSLKEINLRDIQNAGIIGLHRKDLEVTIAVDDICYHVNILTSMDLFAEPGITETQLIQYLAPILEDDSIKIILADAKPIYKELHLKHKITLQGFEDLGVMAYANMAGKHKCDIHSLIEAYIEPEAKEDASTLLKLYGILLEQLQKSKKLTLYQKLDKPLISVLCEMENLGINIDAQYLQELSTEFESLLSDLQKTIFSKAKCEFNIGSPKQLAEVLFNNLSIPYPTKHSKENKSTNVAILEQLSESGFDIADDLLQWRQFSKLLNTYTKSLPSYINPKTHRIHTTFNAVSTSTARLASYDPNLQNIPIRNEHGHKIRGAFKAVTGSKLISADYSQIELRLLAHIADIRVLKEAFINNDDIHSITATQIFGIPLQDVTSEIRRQAKTINFGIIYGISAHGLSKRLKLPINIAKAYIDSYFKQYPGIKEYMDSTIELARANGYVETIFGRRCFIQGINDSKWTIKGMAERAAINAPLQGSAADIIRKAMVSLDEETRKYLMLQIHDELLFEVPESLAQDIAKRIKETMENAVSLSIPLTVDVEIGRSWLEF